LCQDKFLSPYISNSFLTKRKVEKNTMSDEMDTTAMPAADDTMPTAAPADDAAAETGEAPAATEEHQA
jgi:hypothetical protein